MDRGWCNGSTTDFGSVSLGSNPSPRVITGPSYYRIYEFAHLLAGEDTVRNPDCLFFQRPHWASN
jgi:hypothetical protein